MLKILSKLVGCRHQFKCNVILPSKCQENKPGGQVKLEGVSEEVPLDSELVLHRGISAVGQCRREGVKLLFGQRF